MVVKTLLDEKSFFQNLRSRFVINEPLRIELLVSGGDDGNPTLIKAATSEKRFGSLG